METPQLLVEIDAWPEGCRLPQAEASKLGGG